MALTHKNRLKTAVSAVASSGLGAFTIGSAASGYRTFGASDDGNTFDVLILEGTDWEVRRDCAYTHSGTSLARGTLEDSSTGSAIAFTAAAVIVETLTAGRANLLASLGANTFTGAQTLPSSISHYLGGVALYSPNSAELSFSGFGSQAVTFNFTGNSFDGVTGPLLIANRIASGSSLILHCGIFGGNNDVRIHSSGTGRVHLVGGSGVCIGGQNSSAPTAQTFAAQSSRSGADTNVGGASLTIQAGTGTGTGTTASLILQSPVAAASGTSAQTQTTGLTIKNGCAVPRATTVASLPAAASNTDAMLIVTDANTTLAAGIGTTVAAGGANRVGVRSDGTNWIISF